MAYTILTGEKMGKDFLPRIMEVDQECYSDEYVGELSQMEARYERNRDTFVCVMDGEALAGYINFFPVRPELWEEIAESGMKIRDDDIMPEEMADYSTTEPNRIFIISIVVAEKYRNQKEVIKTLTDGFITFLNEKDAAGYRIDALAATAVSNGGQRCLERWMFGLYREIEDGNKVYLCDGIYLEKLKKNELYFKTYHDDVYLFLPFADNPRNTKIEKLFGSEQKFCNEQIPETAEYLLNALDECLTYEYQSTIVGELERVYLGEFLLMHTLDEYPDPNDKESFPHIVGEEKVHLSLLAHHATHMYVVQMFVPDCRYSSSQLEDQLSHGYLKIRKAEDIDEKGFYKYYDVNAYLRQEYGLLQCGKGKSILCMSNKPENDYEFNNILTAEAYNSMHQTFHIDNRELRIAAKRNRAIYDYYEIYMTETVLAFILKDFKEQSLKERIELTATYIFIVELVIFQNIAMNKMTIKVSNALAHEGDVSYQYISQLYRDYAKTLRFWQNDNFMYYGTQKEAEQIRDVFANDELRRNSYELQELLEHMVDLKNAQTERRNGMLINIVAIVLAVMEVQGYMVAILERVYKGFGIPVEFATSTFDVALIGGGGLIFLVLYILNKKNYYIRKKKLSNMVERKDV